GATVRAKRDIDVYALAQKQVQTYAVAVAGGFVGVAGSISVWSIGIESTPTYNTGGNHRGDWVSSTEYKQGDVVTDNTVGGNGKQFVAKNDFTSFTAPHSDSGNWQADEDATQHNGGGGSSAQDADDQA